MFPDAGRLLRRHHGPDRGIVFNRRLTGLFECVAVFRNGTCQGLVRQGFCAGLCLPALPETLNLQELKGIDCLFFLARILHATSITPGLGPEVMP